MKMVKEAIRELLEKHPELATPLQELAQKRGGLDPSQTNVALTALRDKMPPEEIEEILDLF